MTPSSLTIVGGSARAAAQSAVRAGFSPFAGDMFGDEDLRQTCPTTQVADFPEGLVGVCSGPQSGSWIYTGALENHPHLIERMAKIRPLLGNGADVIRRVRDPFELSAALLRAGFTTVLLSRTAAGLPCNGSWLRKPYRSAGGADISRWNAESSANPNNPRFYFQEFVAGEACGGLYVGNGVDARLLGVSRHLPAEEGSFLYHGSIGPIELHAALGRQFERLGQFLAAEFGLVGLFGVDVICRGDDLWPLEVNPRYTASVETLERALGFRAIELHVTGCEMKQLPSLPAASGSTAAKKILYAPRKFTVPDELTQLVEDENSAPGWPSFGDIPASGTLIRAGWPILTVLSAGDDKFFAHQAIARLAEKVWTTLGIHASDPIL